VDAPARARRNEEPLRGERFHFVTERPGVVGVRVEMRDGLLQDSRGEGEYFFRAGAVDLIAEVNEIEATNKLEMQLR